MIICEKYYVVRLIYTILKNVYACSLSYLMFSLFAKTLHPFLLHFIEIDLYLMRKNVKETANNVRLSCNCVTYIAMFYIYQLASIELRK